jgi:alpha-D-xyloside xylohydrolase
MFGPALLISPVTEPGVTEWPTYLPQSPEGWTDRYTGRHYDGGQTVTTQIDKGRIPVFIRKGYEKGYF